MREIIFRQPLWAGTQSGDNFRGWHFWGFIEGQFVAPDTHHVTVDEASGQSQQFTGLRDKSGVEIYEGDVTETTVNQCKWRGVIQTLEGFGSSLFDVKYWQNFDPDNDTDFYTWGDFKCSFRSDLVGISGRTVVIGNIYENPELLK